MFSEAYQTASQYTSPVIVSTVTTDNIVNCSCGAFVVLNDEGWILTVAHLWDPKRKFDIERPLMLKHKQQISEIEQSGLNEKNKKMKIKKLNKDSTWITNIAFWWGMDDRRLVDVIPLEEADLVVGRLEPFNPETISQYPMLKNPEKIKLGTSLCKLGYPFHEISAIYDAITNNFQLEKSTFPIPRFPIEGIYTRNQIVGKSRDGKYEIKFLETSTPGLRGQSGGPIFDSKGVLWAIQSRTSHIPLGFSPKVNRNGKEIEENQFLNVGLGVHPEVIVNFLTNNGIKFEISD